jgi:hypothetical protein
VEVRITLLACNIAACMTTYETEQQAWPRKAPEGFHIFTSPALYNCLSECNAAAAIDHQELLADTDMPGNTPGHCDFCRDAIMADCNHRLSACVKGCQTNFGEELAEREEAHIS